MGRNVNMDDHTEQSLFPVRRRANKPRVIAVHTFAGRAPDSLPMDEVCQELRLLQAGRRTRLAGR